MLQFIGVTTDYATYKYYFNTSHVVVYQELFGRSSNPVAYFNTSHVVVYLSSSDYTDQQKKFQYISCCSLSKFFIAQLIGFPKISIHLMLQFITYNGREEKNMGKFQYISCCSLSIKQNQQQYYFTRFQYISCCSLSLFAHIIQLPIFEFQYISCCSLSKLKDLKFSTGNDFNTSHVVVYLGSKELQRQQLNQFQYISCCSLSKLMQHLCIVQ